MKWYYENFNFSYPQQCIVIPNNTNLPKYMVDFKIGSFYVNRTKNNAIPDEIKELIEKNKNKPRPSLKDHYKDKLKRYHYPQSEGKIKSEIIDLLLQSILKDETIHQAVVKINNYRNE